MAATKAALKRRLAEIEQVGRGEPQNGVYPLEDFDHDGVPLYPEDPDEESQDGDPKVPTARPKARSRKRVPG